MERFVYSSNSSIAKNTTGTLLNIPTTNAGDSNDVIDLHVDYRLFKTAILCIVLLMLIVMTCRFVMRTFSRYVDDGSLHREEE